MTYFTGQNPHTKKWVGVSISKPAELHSPWDASGLVVLESGLGLQFVLGPPNSKASHAYHRKCETEFDLSVTFCFRVISACQTGGQCWHHELYVWSFIALSSQHIAFFLQSLKLICVAGTYAKKIVFCLGWLVCQQDFGLSTFSFKRENSRHWFEIWASLLF